MYQGLLKIYFLQDTDRSFWPTLRPYFSWPCSMTLFSTMRDYTQITRRITKFHDKTLFLIALEEPSKDKYDSRDECPACVHWRNQWHMFYKYHFEKHFFHCPGKSDYECDTPVTFLHQYCEITNFRRAKGKLGLKSSRNSRDIYGYQCSSVCNE